MTRNCKALVASVALALAAAGCTMVGPDYQRPKVDLPEAFPRAATEDAASQIRPDWWTLYEDPTLHALVTSALERNADVRLAVARIEETNANLREANAAFLPEIDLGATATRSRISRRTATPLPSGTSPVRNNVRIAASTSFEIDFWGHLRRGVEAVAALNLASRYARDTVELTLAGVTTQAYFSVRSLDAQIAVTRETLASRQEYEDLVRRRAAGGIASDLEVSQAEGATVDAALQLKELIRQRELVEHELGTLTGRLELKVTDGDVRSLPLPPVPPPGLPSTLLTRRPDVRQAEENLVAANAQIGVAQAERFPLVSLTGSLGAESRSLATLLSRPAMIWSLGPALAMPLFDAGRREARVDAAAARTQQALANYQKAVETAFREVADALTDLQQSVAAEADLEPRLASARNALRLARMRYEAGYSAYLEVLDAQRTANLAELAVIRNRQAMLAAHVDLLKALGGGWSDADIIATP